MDCRWRKNLVQSLQGDGLEDKVILDLGTGTGDQLFEIGKIEGVKTKLLLGLDFSYPMLAQASKKAGGSSLTHAACEALPIVSASIDRIVSAFVMRNIKKVLERSLIEMRRVLKEDGRIYLLEMYVPKSWLLRLFHRAYLKTILPIWGWVICGMSWSGDYLPQTIFEFGTPEEFSEILKRAGFRDIRFKSLMGGVAVLHSASK